MRLAQQHIPKVKGIYHHTFQHIERLGDPLAMATESYDNAGSMESKKEPIAEQLEPQRTASGYIDDRSQPPLLVVHRSLVNPAPLGLLSLATGKKTVSISGIITLRSFHCQRV